MKIGGYRPNNNWLRRQLDTRWRRWVWWCFAGAVAVSVVMAAFVAPRQATLRMRYEIAQLTRIVDQLEGEQRRLQLDREVLTSPPVLAASLDTLGLVPVAPGRVMHLTPDGGLLRPKATPAPTPQVRTARRTR
ncbi:MAG: hypothetical protein A2Y78_11700 [Acidobacteria bacterium RBG_13_68_16]|jgi:hypothetical protein|nr:MAG: hypothetical protein A2Y78_11700 [Acidobacteria bacterium RBG_13_68_16]